MGGARLPPMSSQFESPSDSEEPIPLSVRVEGRMTTGRRKVWSAPPPPVTRKGRSPLATALFGALWIAIGAASVAYVAQRAHDNVAEAR